MIVKREDGCQGASIYAISFCFLPLSLTKLSSSEGVYLYQSISQTEKEITQGSTVRAASLYADNKVVPMWRKLLQGRSEFQESLAITAYGEYLVIGLE